MIGALLLLLATVLLVAGAELFVENAAAASKRLGVTVLAVGLLLAGAEPEELLTGVLASGSGHPGLAAGDALGANVTMLTATLGLAALLRPVPVGHRVRVYGVLSSVAGVLAVLAVLGGHVGRLEGGLLVLAYVVLVAVIWRREQQPPSIGELAEMEEDGEKESRDRTPGVALLLTLVGLAVMTAGGEAAVEGATRVVRSLDQSDTAIGLTLLALATTAELFALVLAAARHDVGEVAVAGIVGSAAYNATATLGTAALVRPLATGAVLVPAIAAAALPLVVLALARDGAVRRLGGAVLVAGYAAYVVFVFVR
ncbi:MAG: cation:H+ antiporter [Actinomycetota bacterium]|jgi:cation:H+ antiporter|nr:cation:H+ antiporter [Actinomycetota bacterium]